MSLRNITVKEKETISPEGFKHSLKRRFLNEVAVPFLLTTTGAQEGQATPLRRFCEFGADQRDAEGGVPYGEGRTFRARRFAMNDPSDWVLIM